MDESCQLTASQALRLVQRGDLTVEDYMKSLLDRIKERDHLVQAWAYLNPDSILAQAKKLDQIPPSQRGPLHGIPIGVKDVILTKGMPLSSAQKLSITYLEKNRHAHRIQFAHLQ
jgi:Asp-tRNA(Asn)/Glu-tRNA(Gln) amidotransferase A subunit family amidase